MQFSSAFETLGVTSLVLGVVVMVGAFVLPLVHRHDESARDRADRLLLLAIVLGAAAVLLTVFPTWGIKLEAGAGSDQPASPPTPDTP